MRILFLSRWYPEPPDNGSKKRVSTLLKALSSRHSVELLSFIGARDNPSASVPYLEPGSVHVVPFRDFNPQSWRSKVGFLSPTPRYLLDTYSPQMDHLIRDTVRKGRFDVVVASQLTMASYHRSFRGLPAVLEEEELAMYLPCARGGRPPLVRRFSWAKHRRYLAHILPEFTLCTVASEEERRLLAEAVPGYRSVQIVPNAIELDRYSLQADRAPDSLIFCGPLSYGPNNDALTWFLGEIFPRIKAARPGLRLTVTGDPGAAALPSGDGVFFTGRVDDVRPLIAQSAVSIVPIRQGGGTRVKILESMALRTPVVATSKGAEGLNVLDGVHLRIANDPGTFGEAILALLADPTYAGSLANNAFELVQKQYDSRAVVPSFLRAIEQAALPGVGRYSGRHAEPPAAAAGA
jgi:polysaccharide biosynthesis protein PslH